MSKLMPTKWSGKEIGVTIGYAVLVAAAVGAYIAKAVLRKPLTKYGMLNGAAPVEAPKEA